MRGISVIRHSLLEKLRFLSSTRHARVLHKPLINSGRRLTCNSGVDRFFSSYYVAQESNSSIETRALDTPPLRTFELPHSVKPVLLQHVDYIEKALAPLAERIDLDPGASLHLSLDAEWNVRRRIGVSVLQLCPHVDPPAVYIIPVHHLSKLPPSLLRLLTSRRVWKIGSHVKGDLTRLRKQFPSQLNDNVRFSTIELKDYARTRGIIQPKQTGTLASLCEIVLGLQLPKDTAIRVSNAWEYPMISSTLIHYAACDVYSSRLIFEKMSATPQESPGIWVGDVEIDVADIQVVK